LTYLEPLDRKALRSILTEPRNSLIKQYVKLFELDKIELTFEEEALEFIVDKAVEFHLGARGLRAICENIMNDAMFESPSKNLSKMVITLEYAQEKIDGISSVRLKAS
jgi:ATP-dependent Clp protease ATP-binding subunit ClpX